tara:strand:- start:3605 stop:3739 length:135 start_codon:yes stop_codon:yes gene_type:complete
MEKLPPSSFKPVPREKLKYKAEGATKTKFDHVVSREFLKSYFNR